MVRGEKPANKPSGDPEAAPAGASGHDTLVAGVVLRLLAPVMSWAPQLYYYHTQCSRLSRAAPPQPRTCDQRATDHRRTHKDSWSDSSERSSLVYTTTLRDSKESFYRHAMCTAARSTLTPLSRLISCSHPITNSEENNESYNANFIKAPAFRSTTFA